MDVSVGQTAYREMQVTAEVVESYARLTGDYNPLHFDEEFASRTRFGRLMAQGGITTGLLHALVAMDMPGSGTVFVTQNWSFTKPVYIGDVIRAEATVKSVRDNHPMGHQRLMAQGGITTGLLHALVAMDMPGSGTVFVTQNWSFTKPVYIGDVIRQRRGDGEVGPGVQPPDGRHQLRREESGRRGSPDRRGCGLPEQRPRAWNQAPHGHFLLSEALSLLEQ